MNVLIKTGLATAVVGMGVLASGSAAYAAPGCLTRGQSSYSLTQENDTVSDNITAFYAKGFKCNAVASELSVHRPGTRPAMTHRTTLPPLEEETPQMDGQNGNGN